MGTISHTRSGSGGSLGFGSKASPVLGVRFNQERSCVSIGLEHGFRIFTTDPLKEVLRRDVEEGGVAVVGMLYQSSLVALVGGGRSPKYSQNKVILFEGKTGKVQAELEFKSDVKNVLLEKGIVVVVLEAKLHIFSLNVATEEGPKLIRSFNTAKNPSGTAAIAPLQKSGVFLVAFPAELPGQVCVVQVGGGSGTAAASLISAHHSPLTCMTLSRGGQLVATASHKGTIIRIFDTFSGQMRGELRRGTERALIYGMDFSVDGGRLCVGSDKGTIHIFNLSPTYSDPSTSSTSTLTSVDTINELSTTSSSITSRNTQSSLSFMKDILPKYFSSQWSFAQGHLSDGPLSHPFILSFGPDPQTIIVVMMNGMLHRFRFDPFRGGVAVKELTLNLLSDSLL